MAKILVTGFEPFHKASLNPSQRIVEEISHDPGVVTSILPVVFGKASELLIELIDKNAPDAVICLGQAEGRHQITPERIAINLDDARIEDNAGQSPREREIVPGGPAGYFSTLPIRAITDALTADGIPAAISLSAGTFLCNHVFYAMQHHCRNRKIKSGFIHVPLMDEQAPEFPGLPTMNIATMVAGVRRVIEVLR